MADDRRPAQPVDDELVAAIRAGLAPLADPQRAPQMQAYMKSEMPYLGVRVPQVRSVVHAAARDRPPTTVDGLVATVAALWDEAEFREQRYAATALTDVPAARRLRTPELISLYERLIVTGAWWDHVDEVAHRVGGLLIAFPDEIRPIVHGWRDAPDHWLRRVSIISQVGAKERTDRPLLVDAIVANAGERDFFLRKAIGWALRDYARHDPDWVRGFVDTHELSPLSRREALKHL